MAEDKVKFYTMKEISEHSSKDSLWLLIDNGVYDVSKFMDEHPGGEEPLLEQAGKDATEAFDDIGHSTDAKALMKEYKIGELCEEERKKSKTCDFSKDCFWIRLLVPIGVVLASVVIYKAYVHYHK